MTQTLRRATIAQVRAGRGGRLVEVDDDIFDLAKRLHEIDTSLGLDWNDAGGYFRVTQALENGQTHVVLTCQELTPEVIERVRLVVSTGYDLVGELDRLDRERERESARRLSEKTGVLGERLHHALRKDLAVKDRIFLPPGVDLGR
jgi:hypothetical protein